MKGTPSKPPLAALAIIVLAFLSGPPLSCSTFSILHHFGSGTDGVSPETPPIVDSHGNVYGTTGSGGTSDDGTVFELTYTDPSGWTETILHSFDFYNDGSGLAAGVVMDSSGNLYGSTVSGGPDDSGTVFELSTNGNDWTLAQLYIGSAGSMVLDGAGNLYTPLGPGNYKLGAIAELSPQGNSWSYTALYSFCPHSPNCSDGLSPNSPLAWDAAGNLYGTTLYAGIYPYPTNCASPFGCGVVFKLTPRKGGAWSYRVLHWFGGFTTDGQLPNGGLVSDGKGNIYGTTSYGGPGFYGGTIFQLSPHTAGEWGQAVGYSETQLYTFPDCTQGCGPFGPLVRDNAGNLYGAAGGGNQSCNGYCGVVYRLSQRRDGSWKYSLLHAFNGSDGNGPNGVTVGNDGNLYGTTISGGQYNKGVVFQITP